MARSSGPPHFGVYERHDGGYLLIATYEDTATVQAQTFVGFDLDLSSLWLQIAGDSVSRGRT